MNQELLVIALGTNQGNKKQQLVLARQALGNILGRARLRSRVYRTSAWGFTEQPDFYNQVLAYAVPKDLNPAHCMKQFIAIEEEMGRIRSQKWGPRIIDIDILYWGNQRINIIELQIPHEAIADRRFVLDPLTEILPHLKHPVSGKSNFEMQQECKDPGIPVPCSFK